MKKPCTEMSPSVDVVHSPTDGVGQANQPWAGFPPDRCVCDLLRFIDCCLSTEYRLHGDGRCESALREMGPLRFAPPPPSLDKDLAALFTRVRRALVGRDHGDHGDPTISKGDYQWLVDIVVPSTVEKLPYVVTVGGQNYSWFVPVPEAQNEYASALSVDSVLRLAVLAESALHPAADGGEDIDGEWGVYRQLEDIARLVRFVQGMRSDPETGGLRVEDRKAFYGAALRVLTEHNRSGRGAAPPTTDLRDPVQAQLELLATGTATN